MTDFHVWWVVFFLILVTLAYAAGRAAGRNILMDGRGRYSLTHVQTVTWTLLIGSGILAVLFANSLDPASLVISPQLFGLMGISVGSAVLATGVKSGKDAPGSSARVAKAGGFTHRTGNTTRTIAAKPSQIWLEEEGDMADEVVSITKFQNVIFTFAVVVAFIAMTWNESKLPELPENLVWLIGISHAGYVGGKVPNKD